MRVYNTTNSGSTALNTSTRDTIGKDGFMKILAAQLQHQDPMNAGSNTEYIAQMAQFSALEQMQNLNTLMNELLVSQKFQEGNLMIGKVAKVYTGEDSFITGRVTSTRLGNGTINIMIDGKEYDIDDVVELQDGGSETNGL
jgi:flagellar basal-body rod modification protein FlgD